MNIEMLSPEDNGWMPIETAPLAGEFLACIRVNHQGIGLIWHQHVLMLNDEEGDIHPDYYQGWALADYSGWHPLPPLPKELT